MKSKIGYALGAAAVLGMASSASAAIAYDQNVTNNVIYGNGNTNGDFTTDRTNGIELGLRGKLRHDANGFPQNAYDINNNNNGIYNFAAGTAINPSTGLPYVDNIATPSTNEAMTAVWAFDWSINSDYLATSGFDLNDFNYTLGLDSDPSQGTNYFTFDPINGINPAVGAVAWDHSMGDNSTLQGQGVEANSVATYGTNISTYSLAQNSWKAHWYIPNFDPTVDGTYNIFLKAFNKTTGGLMANTSIQIVVGQGGAVVPVPAAAPLALLGMGLVAFVRRRKNAKA